MFGTVDVHYPPDGGATAALVIASSVRFAAPYDEFVATLHAVAAYRPGAFFERELPAITTVIESAGADLELLIVDGYVDLDPAGRAGLGRHAWNELSTPVIGVAKTPFRSATHALKVSRNGTRPLFVTSAGLPQPDAAAIVQEMAGTFRLPDALRRVDHLTRSPPPSRPRRR